MRRLFSLDTKLAEIDYTLMPVRFYGSNDRFGAFSNFSRHSFELDGEVWPTVEHYFQAQKFPGTPHAEVIRRAKTPLEARTLGAPNLWSFAAIGNTPSTN